MRKFGIAAKLYLAFGGMFLLAITASIVGWQGFQRISDSQTSVIDQAIPGLRKAHRLAALNTSTSAAAQQLLRARDNAERERTSRVLFAHIDALNELLDEFERSGFAESSLPSLRETVTDLVEKLRTEDNLVQRRLQHQRRLSELVAELESATEELNELADSLVANAAATATAITSSLYDMVEERAGDQSLYRVFDRLVEVDLDAMERMYELRLRSANLRALFTEISKESDLEALVRLRERTAENLSIVKRRVGEINDPQRRQQAERLITAMELDRGPLDIHGLFQTRRELLSIESELSELTVATEAASQRLNQTVNELNTSGGVLINEVSTTAREALGSSRQLFNWISIFSLLVAAIVLWGFVNRSVIRRLLSLETATRSIAGGDYEVSIHDSGNDELANMGKALRVFRNNAIEKRRVDDELQQHKTHLEELVEERTEQLRDANARLYEEAQNHADARARAEQANLAKTAFLATMSHELRTPLSGALGTLRLLEDTSLDSQQRGYTHTVEVANKALLEIVNEILNYSQLEAGKITLDERGFDLSQLLRDVVDLMATPVSERKNRLSLESSGLQGVDFVVGDAGKLHQVLINLIGNANKFTDAGDISLRVDAQRCDSDSLAAVNLEVSDTGIGIPFEHQQKVFQAFTQVDATSSRRYGGIGLGLAICERLVQAMGGSIELHSEPEKGTRVVIGLRLQIADRQVPQEVGGDASKDSAEPLTVLVVEDDDTNRMVAGSYLEKLGHSVMAVDSGRAALQVLDETAPSLILLDISLPEIDGLEVLKKIRAHARDDVASCPVIAMSAHVFAEEIETYLSAGMNGFLGKPYTYQELQAAIHDAQARESVSLDAEIELKQLFDSRVVDADIAELGIERVCAIAEMFVQASLSNLETLESAMRREDWQLVKSQAHKLRGSAANFGFQKLCARLLDIERCASQGCQFASIVDEPTRDLLANSVDSLNQYLQARMDTLAPRSNLRTG